jgi:hypothetical protein
MSIDIVLFPPHNNPLKNNNLVVPLNFFMFATGSTHYLIKWRIGKLVTTQDAEKVQHCPRNGDEFIS